MRLLYTFLFIVLFTGSMHAQRVSGIVIDRATRQPVASAILKTATYGTTTSIDGRFSIPKSHPGDTVLITCFGYKAGHATFSGKPVADTIYLEQVSLMLREVTIRAKHNAQMDSMRMRREFGDVFNYKNRLLERSYIATKPKYIPYDYITSPNNATSILRLNVMPLLSGMFSKKGDQTSKLQEILIKDEQTNFVDQQWTKEKVITNTGLKGDTLQSFMDLYRPTPAMLKDMTGYDLIKYIKKCNVEFEKSNAVKQKPLF